MVRFGDIPKLPTSWDPASFPYSSIDPKVLGPNPSGEGRMRTSRCRWAQFTVVGFDLLFDFVVDGRDVLLGTVVGEWEFTMPGCKYISGRRD